MKVLNSIFLVLIVLTIVSTGCEDQSIIGVDLLDGESIDVVYSDTFTLKARTVFREDDQLATYRTGSTVQTLLVGSLDDPYFGASSSQIFIETGIKSVSTFPDYSEGVFDSMVLVLALDSLGTYGEITSHDIEVYALEESISDLDTVYSDSSFATGMSPIGRRQGVLVNATDSVSIINHADGETINNPPQLRIRLDDDFGSMVFEDTFAIKSDSAFMDLLPGINVRSTSANNSMFGVNLSSTATSSFASSLIMYYTEQDTIKSTFTYSLSGVKFSTFDENLENSEVFDGIGSYDKGTEELYIQAMLGPNMEFDLASIQSLSGKLINKVELELYTTIQAEEQEQQYGPIEDIIASRRNDDGELQVIEDIQLGLLQSGDLDSNRRIIFGGQVTEVDIDGVSLYRYTLNLTNHVLYLLNNPEESHLMTVTPLSRVEIPNRSVIYGTGHDLYPAKLKVTYTEP